MIQYAMQILDDQNNVTKTFQYRYHFGQELYCVYENIRGKHKVKQVEVSGAIYTNMPSYQLTNGWIVLEESLFENEFDAIQRAIYLNQAKKVLH